MIEFLQGRRIGFAPRAHLGQIALGIGIAATLLDLMAWFAWGTRDTNGLAVGALWLVIAAAIVSAMALLTAAAEYIDVDEDGRSLARTDLLATIFATLLYAGSAVLRAGEPGAAAARPLPFLLAIGGLVVLAVSGALAARLYGAREWEEVEPEPLRERHGHRRSSAVR